MGTDQVQHDDFETFYDAIKIKVDDMEEYIMAEKIIIFGKNA